MLIQGYPFLTATVYIIILAMLAGIIHPKVAIGITQLWFYVGIGYVVFGM